MDLCASQCAHTHAQGMVEPIELGSLEMSFREREHLAADTGEFPHAGPLQGVAVQQLQARLLEQPEPPQHRRPKPCILPR